MGAYVKRHIKTFFMLLFLSRFFEFVLQVQDSIRIAEALLMDLSGFKAYLCFSDELLELLRAYEQEEFEDWSREILSGLGDPKSGIRLEIKLSSIITGGILCIQNQ